jgi:hypothetical protein
VADDVMRVAFIGLLQARHGPAYQTAAIFLIYAVAPLSFMGTGTLSRASNVVVRRG